ncbi:MAG: phenylalanine--tRNA ligase subunit beta, partial [Acidimicrobiia bacterium]
LGDDHSGILELPVDTALGADVRPILGLDDVVFDLAITPNRPDAMSIVGIARELAAAFGKPLRLPDVRSSPELEPDGTDFNITIENPELCAAFVGRVVEVTLGSSPEWMQQRLLRGGMRPINNVVDVTNYVLLEWGRPLHAFDLDRLGGGGLVARAARDGEQITTLDGVDRTLLSTDLVIADSDGTPHAIAGVMGGAAAEVGPQTRRIVLESAYFAPTAIAATAKRLNLRSEASARFERGIDPHSLQLGADRAAQLLVDVAEAVPMPGHIAVIARPAEVRTVAVRTSRVNSILGLSLASDAIPAALEPLGFECESSDSKPGEGPGAFKVNVPTWRPDIEREIDLIEEVARRVGLDSLPRTVPSSKNATRGLSDSQRARRLIQDAMVGCGLHEAITLPLINPTTRTNGGWAADEVRVANPLRSEESALRSSLLPGLVDAAAFNVAQGTADTAFFELGHVFGSPKPDSQPLPNEREHLAILLTGLDRGLPLTPDRPVEAADAVAVLRDLMGALRIGEWDLVNSSDAPGFDSRSAANILIDGRVCGAVGNISSRALEAAGVTGAAAGFEIEVAALLEAPRRSATYVPFSRFPAARFDLAFMVSLGVAAEAVERAIRAGLAPLEAEVRCFDVFIAEEHAAERSIAFAVAVRGADATLGDADIHAARVRAIDAVAKACGGRLRS